MDVAADLRTLRSDRHTGSAEAVQVLVAGDGPRLGDITLVGQPLRMSRAPDPPYRPAPERGQHNEEVYHALGVGDEELRSLREQGDHLKAIHGRGQPAFREGVSG